MFIVALLALASSAMAQAPAPAPAPAQSAPPPGSPAVAPAPAPAPAPGTVQYAQPAPAPYYGQQQYPQQQYPQQQYPQQQPYAGQQPYAQGPVYAPPPNYAPPQPRYRPRRGLLVGGIAMFGGSYLFTAISGGVMMDISRLDCRHCQDVGPLLLIPVAGPFVAMSEAASGEAFLVLDGLVQIGGLTMIVVGAIQYSASKKRAQQQGMYTFELPEGRALSLDLSASPLRLGPSARLRF